MHDRVYCNIHANPHKAPLRLYISISRIRLNFHDCKFQYKRNNTPVQLNR